MLEGFSSAGSTLQRPPTTLRSYLPNQMCWAARNHSTGPSSTRWFRTLPLAWARWNLMQCGDWRVISCDILVVNPLLQQWYLVISLLFPTVSNFVHCVHRCFAYDWNWNVCPGEWLVIFELARDLHRLGHAAKLWLLRGALFHLLAQWTAKVAALGRWSNLVVWCTILYYKQ